MTKRDWWIGIAVLAASIVFHAAVPRYDWRNDVGVRWLRIDRWTGVAELVITSEDRGTIYPLRPRRIIRYEPDPMNTDGAR